METKREREKEIQRARDELKESKAERKSRN
jgi:hypothetical protein